MKTPPTCPPVIHRVTFIRGKRWTLTTRLRVKGDPAFSWDGLVAVFRIKGTREPSAPLLVSIVPTVSAGVGVAVVVVDIPGTLSGTLPDSFVGDLEVSRTSPAIGPYAPVQIDFTLAPSA